MGSEQTKFVGIYKVDHISIFHLYVSETARGRKVGTYLLFKTIQFALDSISGLTRFELQTNKSNDATQKIIAKLGFVEI